METERINSTWNELVTFDPSLIEHEASVRSMMSELSALRPVAEVDAAFRTSLRARLMLREHGVRSPFASLIWLAFRVVPLGAVALLVFTLTQSSPTYIETRSSPTTEPSHEAADTYTVGAPAEIMPQTTSNARSVNTTLVQPEPSMSMKSAAPQPTLTSHIFTISPQPKAPRIFVDTVTTKQAGFIVVEAGMGGEPFGVSPIINPGTTNNLPIDVYFPETGQPYDIYAYFVFDNGDRVFNEFDTVEDDGYGTYIWVLLNLY